MKKPEVKEPKIERNDNLDLDVKFDALERKVIAPDFSKQIAREDDPRTNLKPKEDMIQLEIKDDVTKTHVGTAVNMSKGDKRFKEPKSYENNEPGQQTTSEKIDYDLVMKAIKPEVGIVGFKGYAGREKPLIKRKEEKEDKSKKENIINNENRDDLNNIDSKSVMVGQNQEENSNNNNNPSLIKVEGERLSAVYGVIKRDESNIPRKNDVSLPEQKDIAPWAGDDQNDQGLYE